MIGKIRSKLNLNLGKNVMIKYSLGRNKFEIDKVLIIEIYENIFLVKLDNNIIKSFTYNDILTKTLKIKY